MYFGSRFSSGMKRSATELTGMPAATVLGWMDEAPPEVQVNGEIPQQAETGLYLTELPYNFAVNGEIKLPPGFIPGLVSDLPLSGGTCGVVGTSIWLDRGEAFIEFVLPPELRDISTSALLLALQTDGPWNNIPQIEFYAWDSESWQPLEDAVIGDNRITDPEILIGDQGFNPPASELKKIPRADFAFILVWDWRERVR